MLVRRARLQPNEVELTSPTYAGLASYQVPIGIQVCCLAGTWLPRTHERGAQFIWGVALGAGICEFGLWPSGVQIGGSFHCLQPQQLLLPALTACLSYFCFSC